MKPSCTPLAWLLAAALPAFAACPPPPEAGARLDSGPVQLAWRAEPASIAVSRPFALLVTLCPADARLLRVDATMPEHRHGMNYRPSVQALGAQSFAALWGWLGSDPDGVSERVLATSAVQFVWVAVCVHAIRRSDEAGYHGGYDEEAEGYAGAVPTA